MFGHNSIEIKSYPTCIHKICFTNLIASLALKKVSELNIASELMKSISNTTLFRFT